MFRIRQPPLMPDPLHRRIAGLPPSPYASAAFESLQAAAVRQGSEKLLASILADERTAAFLGTALGDCPFLLDLASKDLPRLADVLRTDPRQRLADQDATLQSASWSTRQEAMQALRKAKQNVALTLGLSDLAGAVSLDEATQGLTSFADAALDAALRFALEDAARSGTWAGGAEATGFFLLAMGKHGAGELNYSSDIDLIALFDGDASGLAPDTAPSTFWVRIVRTLVTLMQERTADGYVFRTDLRLRPDPGATAVAISAAAAVLYYESMGQNWERAALIKARACAGDIAAGEAFLAEIAPFIWRKYLDYAAIADIHSIKRQVHAHRGHSAVAVLGHDIKRGRGGIREIEFFVQTQQLIAGGRDRTLRGRETRTMLGRLQAKGWIDEAARAELDEAYVFLRMVEHRLQMVRDEQTHTMPRDPGELARIGRLMGYADAAVFEAELRGRLERVARRYSELFRDAPDLSEGTGSLVFTGGEDDPATLETIRRLGFAEPANVTDTVRGWHFGRFAAMRSTAAREALTEITPALLQAFSRAGNPDNGLRAFDKLLRALPAGAQLFALLRNNRELLDMLATILGAAPGLAEVFGRRPHVVDALLEPGAAGEAYSLAVLTERLAARLADAPSLEEVLNRTRLFAAEQRFGISVGLLRGDMPATDAGRAFSDLAEAVVATLFHHVLREFERQHGRIAAGEVAILAFGRLGSREMTAGSDLDLIVIYDHAPDAPASDGPRPLPPSQYYTRLTQRLVAALSAPTAEGIAYPVDLRLRPSGRAGPLATHIASFEQYQRNDAWTWEHMAMSRGRPIAGERELILRVSAVLDGLAAMPRDPRKLGAEIAEMRGRIEREKRPAGDLDVKLAPGGLVDCEFAAQYLVLAGLGRVEGETSLQTLLRGRAAGSLAEAEGEVLVKSINVQSAILQILRVAADSVPDAERAPDALKRILVSAAVPILAGDSDAPPQSFATMQAVLTDLQRDTRACVERVLGTPVGAPA
jgi:glutamate-ammonia-ligase adenylyltransferase